MTASTSTRTLRPTAGEAPTGAEHHTVPVVLRPGVSELVHDHGEDAVSLELTVEFGCLVIKHAVAYPGASDPEFGYSRVRSGEVDVWWRQRILLPGREPVTTTSIRPRRLTVSRVGRALSVTAAYA